MNTICPNRTRSNCHVHGARRQFLSPAFDVMKPLKRIVCRYSFLILLVATRPSVHADIPGFGDGTGWTLNNNGAVTPTISAGVLTLTTNQLNQAASAFFNTPQNITAFTADFTYQASGNRQADGVTFVMQNDSRGLNALGGAGHGLGYGVGDGGTAIGNSVAFALDIFQGVIGLATNGSDPPTSNPRSTSPITLGSGDPIQVHLVYNGSILSETLKDLTTLGQFSSTDSVNIPSFVGNGTALVGFTGATGDDTSTQTLQDFTFTAVPEPDTWLMLAIGSAILIRRRRSA
jgi:Bacterial lectin/PEP-CTERM motif